MGKVATENTLLEIRDILGHIDAGATGTINDLSSLADILAAVRSGKQGLTFNHGDQIIPVWQETASGTAYDDPFDIVQIECTPELKNGETVHGMMLQQHYANVRACPFDPQEALYDADEELQAGTYHFTVACDTWLASENGKVYQFTLTQPIPAGGQLVYTNPDAFNKTLAGQSVSTYSGPTSFTAIETAALSEGSDGTDLGATDGAGNLNHHQRAFRGSGRWKTSMLRQYLNSSKAAGEWWTKQNKWDRASAFISSCPGYMAGFSADFLAVIKPVKVQTSRDTVVSDGGADITYDYFFPISLQQMNVTPQIADIEGEALGYWKEVASGASNLDDSGRFKQGIAYPDLICYGLNAKSSARYCWLRSAYRGNSYYAWNVNTSGFVGNSSALNGGYYCAPACVIC